MAKLNTRASALVVHTHEGARAYGHMTPVQALRRSVMCCLLWEDSFYEDGQSIADRIELLAAAVAPEELAAIAIEARERFHLRHVPLLLCALLAKHGRGAMVGRTIAQVIQRADELSEFLAIYWRHGRCPLSKQVKVGLALAFQKFGAYALAKYDRESKVKLRDVLFLCHAKPRDAATLAAIDVPSVDRPAKRRDGTVSRYKRGSVQRHPESLNAKLIAGTLPSPETWENRLSRGEDKKAAFEAMMAEGQLGGLAFLRNLRNMHEAGIDGRLVAAYSNKVNVQRVLPFRFIAAARAVPQWEAMVERMMLESLAEQPKLPGRTVLVVDNSESMHGPKISAKSDIDRADAAGALAILLREVCQDCLVIGFGDDAAVIPARRGFALADAIKHGPGGGTNTRLALVLAGTYEHDRIIVITDEQSHQQVTPPRHGVRGYFINVATYQNGIGYGAWLHIDGWSEAVLDFIREVEVA